MSEIKKKIGIITRDVVENTSLNDMELTGWAKSLDFYNYGETIAYLKFAGDDNEAPGVRLPAGQNFTLEGNDDIGINLSGISIEFAESATSKAINITIEKHSVI